MSRPICCYSWSKMGYISIVCPESKYQVAGACNCCGKEGLAGRVVDTTKWNAKEKIRGRKNTNCKKSMWCTTDWSEMKKKYHSGYWVWGNHHWGVVTRKNHSLDGYRGPQDREGVNGSKRRDLIFWGQTSMGYQKPCDSCESAGKESVVDY